MVERQLTYIQLSDLHFDRDNPRLPSDVAAAGDEAVFHWLLTEGNLIELMGSIGAQDFFPGEPLLVSTQHGELTVVEGNRRLAACRLLTDPGSAPIKKRAVAASASEAQFIPQQLPCLLFESRDEILGFLGYRHITGIREWDPQAKARYLRQLYARQLGEVEDADRALRAVARRIGSRSDYVARILTSLALYEAIDQSRFFEIDGVSEATFEFSLLTVGINRPQIVKFLGLSSAQDFELAGLDLTSLEKFTRWVYAEDERGRTVLGESRHMSRLAAVVDDDVALDLLESGASLEEAWLLATDPTDDIAIRIEHARGELVAAVRMMERGYDLDFDPTTVLDELRRLIDELSAHARAATARQV